MKKVLLQGILAGCAGLASSLVMGYVMNGMFPGLVFEYDNPSLFRPWSDPLMSLYFLHPFVLGIILAFVFSKTKKLFVKAGFVQTGLRFGGLFWFLTSIPGMLISYSTFPVSLIMIVSWSMSSLAMILASAIVLAKLQKEE
ncbi:MAG: hypothetical protein Q8Q49_05195 [bacterium]|nr:hypothetical protein [bacterium]